MPDPWSNVIERYPVGIRVTGKVVSLTDYGAFIELEPGVEGLIHVSEMSWSKRVKHPSKILNQSATRSRRWCSASIRARAASRSASSRSRRNPWHELAGKYPVGTTITGKVRNLTEFGAFVEVEEGIDGLIHISDMSWSKIKHPSEVLKKGDTVEAQVLSIDADNQRLSLGLKQLQTGIWKEFFDKHHVGDVVEGKVVRLTNFGAFVELADGIEGPDPRLGVRLVAGRREARAARGRELPDEDHPPGARGAEDRPQHPRAQGRGVPRRLGGLHRDDGPAGSDAGRSLQAPEVVPGSEVPRVPGGSRVRDETPSR